MLGQSNVSTTIIGAVAAGFFSWVYLNRYDMRGDYIVLLFTVAFSFLYFTYLQRDYEQPFLLSVITAASYLSALSASTIIYRLSPTHPLAKYPGPTSWRLSSIILAVVSFRGRRHLVLERLHRKYGKFVRIGPNALSVNSGDAANAIYGAKNHMEKSESYATPGHVEGVALFFKVPNDAHMKRKKIWSGGFVGSAVDHYFPPLERRTWQLTHCIENRRDGDGIINLGECIVHWSYDFMVSKPSNSVNACSVITEIYKGEMVFGGSNNLELMKNGDPEDLIGYGKKATILVDSVGQTPWLMDILWHIPGGEALHRLQEISAKMMRTRVKSTKDVEIRDLASYLIEGDIHTGERISMGDLEIDSLIAIQAGSDNTGSSMLLSIFFMLSHPPTYQTLQTALDCAFKDPTAPLDNKKLAAISFLDAVINESLRLGTPFFLPRIVPKGGVLVDDEFVPGGTIVALAAYSQQVSENNFYPDPLHYRPERWLPGGLGPESILNKSALVSFSSGPYVCVAKSFALQEMRLVLARLVLTFDMELAPLFDAQAFLRGFRNMRTTVFDERLLVRAVRRKGMDTPDVV